MECRERSIPAALAASQLSLMLALLLLTPMPPVTEPHPTSATRYTEIHPILALPPAAAAAAPEFEQPPDCPVQRSFQVMIEGEDAARAKGGGSTIVTLHLAESSADFLHSSERNGGGGGVVGYGGLQLEPRLLPPCFYQGSVEGEGGLAVAKERDGFISGNFHYAGRVFGIAEQPVAAASAASGLLRARQLPPSQRATCGVSGAPIDNRAEATNGSRQNQRDRRSLLLDSVADSSSKKYIQLILIGDQYFYHNQSRNMVKAQDRLWEVGNYVHALYKQLGVNVITVYTETWQTDPYKLRSATKPSGANSTELLDLFMVYRMQRLSSRPHSVAHLLTGLKFEGTDVGLANLGKLCSFEGSGGVNSDRDDDAYGVAATVAHELGHNLGLEHDKDERSCPCPDTQGCLMAAVGSDIDPVQFSSCSVSVYKDFSATNGLGYCMSDPPADAAIIGAKVTCGNRIVEPGEECDCGPAKWCKNRCCNPATCRFTAGAVCASGECCDQATCRLKPQATVCRTERDTCDLPEYCNGTSEWCPQLDDYKADGTECLAGKAYCYKGRCGDRDSRCAALFQGDNVRSAPADWSVAATMGTAQGYCSYSATKLDPLIYAYTACTSANQRCGVLYCVGAHSDKLTSRWKGLPSPQIADTIIGELTILAAYVQHDLKPSGYRDPGLVPNGAQCGTNMMCVDSQCVSTTASSASCPSCNGRGACARSGLCFCQAGFSPPNCLQAGNGGSLANPMPAGGSTTGASASTSRKSAGPSAFLDCPAAARLLGLVLVATCLNFQ